MKGPLTGVYRWVLYSIGTSALVLALALHVHRLNSRIADLEQAPALSRGQRIAPFRAEAMTGNTVEIGFDSIAPRRLFAFVSPDCPFSMDSVPELNRAAERLGSQRVEILGILIGSPGKQKAHRLAESIRFPLVALGASDLAVFGRWKVPQAVLVDRYGRVQFSQTGQFSEATTDEILSALSRGGRLP